MTGTTFELSQAFDRVLLVRADSHPDDERPLGLVDHLDEDLQILQPLHPLPELRVLPVLLDEPG